MTNSYSMSRRHFVQTLSVAGAALAAGVLPAEAAPKSGVNWPVGCFNRPWVKEGWDYEVALKGIKAAGYKLTGLLTKTKEDPFIGVDATPEYLANLAAKLKKFGLKANMGSLRIKTDGTVEEQIKDVQKQIDNAHTLALEFALTFGVDKAEHFENYYKVMQNAAPYAQERGIKLVLKPHGGASGASEEIQRCLEKVKQPNFKIWFDAGNIIYYTGKDPIEQLKPIAEHVTGFCAKDCDKQSGEVFLEFGQGKVDFAGVFGVLKNAGFNGPIMVECCQRAPKANVIAANAKTNRVYLEKVLAAL